MTKVRDLVTVMMDSVFMQFPVDDERYELILAVGRRWHCRLYGNDSVLPSGDAHVNLTIASLVETLQRGSDALAAESFRPQDLLSKLDYDRARRTYASIDREQYREAIQRVTEPKAAAALVTTLLGNLYEQLLVLHHIHTRPSMDKGTLP
jgi:hypothetical protein